MRASKRRHLGRLASAVKGKARLLAAGASGPYETEFAPRDYVSFLLHVDAEIEHGLMVQYLYAAYSLGGAQVPPQHRQRVRGWQEVMLGIAKEEMGHLISIQNVLRLIGAPLNLGRDDYPWDVPFYPFPFMLERLTLDSLAKYVYAESPQDWSGPLADEIRARVATATPNPHRVSELFALMIELVQDSDYLCDSVFQADTYPFQASWAEWGRGYQGGQRGNSTHVNPKATPDVLVLPLASRDDAVAALQQIAEQGEATHAASREAPSHFARFVRIYEEMKALAGEGWQPSRPVATNPYVTLDPTFDPAQDLDQDAPTNPIRDPLAQHWASLHNLRYRMLLTYLSHTFTLRDGLSDVANRTPRGLIINATFGEMYNLRAIAEILMQTPIGDPKQPDLLAGPPFQMPYTLDSPLGEPNRWRMHLDLLIAAERLVDLLLATAPASQHTYLQAMRAADCQMRAIAERLLAGHAGN